MFDEGFEKIAVNWNSVANSVKKSLPISGNAKYFTAAPIAAGALVGATARDEFGQRKGVKGALKGAALGAVGSAAINTGARRYAANAFKKDRFGSAGRAATKMSLSDYRDMGVLGSKPKKA